MKNTLFRIESLPWLKKNLLPFYYGGRFGLYAVTGLLVIACTLAVSPVSAKESTYSAARQYAFMLQDFMPEPEPIRLISASARHDLFLPVSSRYEVSHAELRLKFTNSISLIDERSQLRVLLNDGIVVQFPLKPRRSQVEVVVDLPVELMRPGFNKVSFVVVQHYTLECEDPHSPELWTEIDTVNSSIVLTGNLREFDATLAELGSIMGPAIGNPRSYQIITADVPSESEMAAAARVSQAIGQRLEYRIPRIQHSQARAPVFSNDEESEDSDESLLPGLATDRLVDRDVFLIGTRQKLQPYLSRSIYEAITDAYLTIVPHTSDPRFFIFVVSGTNDEEVERAARTLGHLNFPFADSASSLVRSTTVPQQASFGRKKFVNTGSKYLFSGLGYETRSIFGAGVNLFKLEFDLPADFYAPENDNVKLSLDFAYGANLREDSVLNLYLNGVFERAIALNDSEGAVLRNYELFIPLRSFRPGRNDISFEPVLVPLVSGECIAVQDRNLLFTMFDSSEIDFPNASRYSTQPDLKLFSRTGFPYWHRGNDTDFDFAVLSQDNQTLGSVWTLVSRLAQVADSSLMNSRFHTSVPDSDRHMIVVSPVKQLPEQLLSSAPLNPLSGERYPYLAGTVSDSGSNSTGVLSRIMQLLGLRSRGDDKPTLSRQPVLIEHDASPVEHLLVTAYESPYASERTVTLFTAATAELLYQGIGSLAKPELWSQLQGDISVWSEQDNKVTSQTAGSQFHIGELSTIERLRFHLSLEPWKWILAVAILIILLAWLTQLVLNRIGRKRQGGKFAG